MWWILCRYSAEYPFSMVCSAEKWQFVLYFTRFSVTLQREIEKMTINEIQRRL